MKTYTGRIVNRGTRSAAIEVSVDATPLRLRLDLFDHSPTGFTWGYGGSGAAQLALAILADCAGDAVALRFHQGFKWQVIANLNLWEAWQLTETQVRNWLQTADIAHAIAAAEAERDDHPIED